MTFSFGKPDVRIGGPGDEPAAPSSGTPFHVLLIGDFTGRASRGVQAPLRGRRSVQVDRDTLEDVMERLGTGLSVPLGDGSAPAQLTFKELEDFHPDTLFSRVSAFQELVALRARLENPKTFEAAAKEMGALMEPEPAPAEPSGSGSILDAILSGSTAPPPSAPLAKTDAALTSLAARLAAPFVVAREHPQKAELLAAADQSLAEAMRRVLHDARFQELECAWRSVDFLIRRLDDESEVVLHLLDVSRAELAADLAGDDLSASQLYRILVSETVDTPGEDPWALVASFFTFDATAADAELLGRLSRLAKSAGAPFVATAHPRLAGCDAKNLHGSPEDWTFRPDAESAAAWAALRALPSAGFAGLALPRFLLRLPYGKTTEPIERFEFEELAGHETYLWGPPAVLVTLVLAQAFERDGWDLDLTGQDVEDLPLHVTGRGAEARTTPCAETVLTIKAAEHLAGRGLIAMLSIKDRDTVRVPGFPSITGKPLSGRFGD